jgi:hypothetical protein
MTEAQSPTPEGFTEFFEREILPGLAPLEEQRRDRLRAATARAAGSAIVVVLASLIAWLLEQPIAAAVILPAGAISGYFWARQPARQHRAALRDLVIPPLLRILGDVDYHRQPGWHFELERFRRSGVLPTADKAKVTLEDLIVGRYRDTDYRVVEARLKAKSRSRNNASGKLLFAGLLCDVSVPQDFAGRVLLVAAADDSAGPPQQALPDGLAGLSALSLNQPDFEKRFAVYSDSPRMARGLLQPALLESLLSIADDLKVRALTCAFLEGRFLIALPEPKNLFEIGRLRRSLEMVEQDLRRLAVEFTLPQRLIDNLHSERKPLLPSV